MHLDIQPDGPQMSDNGTQSVGANLLAVILDRGPRHPQRNVTQTDPQLQATKIVRPENDPFQVERIVDLAHPQSELLPKRLQ